MLNILKELLLGGFYLCIGLFAIACLKSDLEEWIKKIK